MGCGVNGVNVINGGILILNGLVIKIDGVVVFGISNNKGIVNLQGGMVMMIGFIVYGVFLMGLGSSVDINGIVIFISGLLVYGILGVGGVKLIVNNMIFNVSGGGSYGIYLSDIGSVLSGVNNIINNISSVSGIGVYIGNGGINVILDNIIINMINGYVGVSVGWDLIIIMDGLMVMGNMNQVFDIIGLVIVSNVNIDLVLGVVLCVMGNSLINKVVIILNNINVIFYSSNVMMVNVNMNVDVMINGGFYYFKGIYVMGIWVLDMMLLVKVNNVEFIIEGDGVIVIENWGIVIVDSIVVRISGNSFYGIYLELIFNVINMSIFIVGVGSIGVIVVCGGNLNLVGVMINIIGVLGMVFGIFIGLFINVKNIIVILIGVSVYVLWI